MQKENPFLIVENGWKRPESSVEEACSVNKAFILYINFVNTVYKFLEITKTQLLAKGLHKYVSTQDHKGGKSNERSGDAEPVEQNWLKILKIQLHALVETEKITRFVD